MLNVVWAKFEKPNQYNFGDDLTPYLFSKLTNERYRYIKFASTRFQIIKEFIAGVINGKFSIIYLNEFLRGLFIKNYIVSIGSVLSSYSSDRCIVWGAGIISKNDKIRKSNFLAVRGKYTLNAIRNIDCNSQIVLGDPSILLPLVYTPKTKKKFKLGIIPHIIHYDKIKNLVNSNEINVINLNSSDSEKVIDEIYSCEYTISTSLHGLIISHVYGIKSLWYELKDTPLYGDDIKFFDYFTSVEIPEYKPFVFLNEINANNIISNIEKNNAINKINKDIKYIQKDLLDVAPFKVKDQVIVNLKNIE